MMNRKQIIFFSFDELIKLYLGLYFQEYGKKKGVEVISKIQTSKKIQVFITRIRIEKLNPGDAGFITMVNSIPYFLFSKGETLGAGALLSIQQWIDQTSMDTFKLNDSTIHSMIVETIFRAEKTKVNLSGNLTFFDKYYSVLDNAFKNSIAILSGNDIGDYE